MHRARLLANSLREEGKGEAKGAHSSTYRLLPHRFLFQDLPTSNNPNTIKTVWKCIWIQLVHTSPITCYGICSME